MRISPQIPRDRTLKADDPLLIVARVAVVSSSRHGRPERERHGDQL
jgi:hypothetical protein